MRCLRCALEYGPEERYCHRCGRALSKPIGVPRSPGADFEGLQDTAHLYSTFSPPTVEEDATAYPRIADDSPSPAHAEDNALSAGAWHDDLPRDEDDDPWAEARAGQSQDEEPFETPDGIPREVLVPVNDDDDLDDAASDEAPAVVDRLDDARGQGLSYGTPRRDRRLPMRVRRLALLVALLALLCVAGGFAWNRHATFADNVSSARALAARGHYQAAIDAYQRAIAAWPLNDDAKAGRAAARAALGAQQASAAAAVAAARAHVQAEQARIAMLTAKQSERRAVARQFDAGAPASPVVQQALGQESAATTVRRAAAAHAARNTAVPHAVAGRAVIASAAAPVSRAKRLARVRASLAAGKPLVYAAIGASETVGVGAADPATQSWVADLARRLPPGSRLLNLGKSGALISYGVGTEMPSAIAGNPDLITIWMAVNDLNALLASRPTQAAFAQQVDAVYAPQLTTLLTTLRLRTHAALFVGNIPDLALEPVYRSQGLTEATLAPYITTFNRTIASIARGQGARVVDLYAPTKATLPTHPDYVSGDGFHPSTSGYASIAAVWWQAVRGTASSGR